jgi:hypothetical protein
MNMYDIDFRFEYEQIIEDLVNDAEELGFELNANRIYFDDSRSWSLYIHGSDLDLDVYKFGAYRNYLGGGMRSGICSNGRAEDNTLELAGLFEEALKSIENLYNAGYEEAEEWDKPTGVLL